MNRLIVLLQAGILLLITVATGCNKQAPSIERPAPQVSVLEVKPQTIPYTETFVAQTESSRQVDITARVSGFLDKIAYKEGELVNENQVLFQLDPKPFQAQLDAARGQLQAQQARLFTARATLDRVKPLTEQNALSEFDLDRAQGEFEAATAAVFVAQANVKEAELNLGYTSIYTPVTGIASRSIPRRWRATPDPIAVETGNLIFNGIRTERG